MRKGTIGIFDSGLGGLLIARSVIQKLPRYDYAYLGDTKRVPYGDRSEEEIYTFLREGVEFLFKQGCVLVIVACNTASANALRKIQRRYLPRYYPNRRVLGVIIPAAEYAVLQKRAKRVGIIATKATVASGAYRREIKKLAPRTRVFQLATPLLVPFIEANRLGEAQPILERAIRSLLRKRIDTLLLGCTHYPLLKRTIRDCCGKRINVIAQDEIIPRKLLTYLLRHPEIEKRIGTRGQRKFFVTDITENFSALASRWFGKSIVLKKTTIET